MFSDSNEVSIIFRGVSLAFGFWFVFGAFVGYESLWLPLALLGGVIGSSAIAKRLEK